MESIEKMIRITYSWGDEEEPIPCEESVAFEKMLELSSSEVEIVTREHPDTLASVIYEREHMTVTVYYSYDNTWCRYRYC